MFWVCEKNSLIVTISMWLCLEQSFFLYAFADIPETNSNSPETSSETSPETSPETSSETSPDTSLEQNPEASPKTKEITEDEKAAFFRKAFGKEMPEVFYPHTMQLILDQNVAFEVVVEINPYTQAIRFDTNSMIPFLEEYLLQAPLKQSLKESLPEKLGDDVLRQYGFDIQMNMKRQMIAVTTPLALRKEVNIPLKKQARIEPLPSPKNLPISGYINMSHGLNMYRNKKDYTGHYNFNMNIQDLLVQSEVQVDNANETKIIITGGRIIKDIPDRRIRLTFGDNSSPNADLFLQRPPMASGFQETLVGFDISHVGQFDRRRSRSSDFQHTLIVEEESRIEIAINGRIVYNEILVSGKYDFQDFPFQTGKNDVLIRCIDGKGMVQEIELEYFQNPSLLQKGQKEYQIVTGIPYENASDIRRLNSNRFTNLAYLRYGYSDTLGTTAYIQTVRDHMILGAIGEYGFDGNIASVEVTYSNNFQQKKGYAIRFQAYSSNSNTNRKRRGVRPNYYTLNIDYLSPDFDRILLEDGIQTNDVRSIISPSFIWQLSPYLQTQFRAVVRDNRSTPDTTLFEIRSYYRANQFQFDFSLGKTTGGINDDFTFLTNITWQPKGKQRNRFNYRYNSRTEAHGVSANFRPKGNTFMNYHADSNFVDVENFSLNGMLQYQTLGNSLAGTIHHTTSSGRGTNEVTLDYDGARALIDINHMMPVGGKSMTSLRMDTAVAFVGSHWGVSRPISKSFAILYPNNDGLKDSHIVFKNGSILDNWSSAVYPLLGNYQTNEIEILSAHVPIGLDLGTQQYVLQGRLNSGQAIPIGKPGGIIMASAVLLKPNGKPFDLEVGNFVSVHDPSLKVQFFTNRSGKLFVQGLTSGQYRIELLGNTYADVLLAVPKSAASPVDLGTITLTPKEPAQ